MQDGEDNRAKANRETHQAPGRFVSDATISFVHYIRLQSVDGFLLVFADALEPHIHVDGLEICVYDVRWNHRADEGALYLSASYSVGCVPPSFRASVMF